MLPRCCLTEELPVVHRIFNLKARDAPHPLFADTYTYACTVNQRIADAMECCIVR
jgi:hypothetical protein